MWQRSRLIFIFLTGLCSISLLLKADKIENLNGYDIFSWGLSIDEFLVDVKKKYGEEPIKTDLGGGVIDYHIREKEGTQISFLFIDKKLSSVTVIPLGFIGFQNHFKDLEKKYGKPDSTGKEEGVQAWKWAGKETNISAYHGKDDDGEFFNIIYEWAKKI